eukprot:jgi/Chlat1/415/Chrsp10S01512
MAAAGSAAAWRAYGGDCVKELKEQSYEDLAASLVEAYQTNNLAAASSAVQRTDAMLKGGSGWPLPCLREAACLARVARACLTVEDKPEAAMQDVDMALIFGLPYAVVDDTVEALESRLRAQQSAERFAGKFLWAGGCPVAAPHIDPTRSVQVLESAPSASDFRSRFLKTEMPVIIKGLQKGWPAAEKWNSLQYLDKVLGHRTVPVEIGHANTKSFHEKAALMSDFIAEYLSSQDRVAYLAQHPLLSQVPALEADVSVPTLCSEVAGDDIAVSVWLGTANTRTPLHWDSYENFFAQVQGYKYVRLYARSESMRLYASESKGGYGAQGNISNVDPEAPDYDKYPTFKDAIYLEVVLGPGDTLFIPGRVWHYVRSLTPSFSVSFMF